jgi:hypothetical protein
MQGVKLEGVRFARNHAKQGEFHAVRVNGGSKVTLHMGWLEFSQTRVNDLSIFALHKIEAIG